MTRRVFPAVAVLAAALVAPSVAAAPATAGAPGLSRPATAILIDARDGTVIAAKNPRQRRAMASTTKLMTALLALERAKPADVFRAPAYDALPAESKINLRAGERMRVDDLLEALLLESANDAAETLAEGISGSRANFVAAMNARARKLRLRDTSYANPIGLDDPLNRSSARDLAALARLLLRDERFAATVRRQSAVLESGARRRVVHNRNDLVGRIPGVDGVKTGHTRDARYVLVGSATGRLGARVISVVMGEPGEAARDADSVALLRYGLAQFRRVKPLDSDRPVASVPIAHRNEEARLVPERDALIVARKGERVATRVDAPDEVDGPMDAGERVGSVAVVRGGKVVRRVPLVTAADVPGAGPLRVLADELGTFLTVLLIGVILGLVAVGLTRIRSRRRERELADRRRARERAGRAAEPHG